MKFVLNRLLLDISKLQRIYIRLKLSDTIRSIELQVVVQKHGRAGEMRMPRASSPLRAPLAAGAGGAGGGDAGGGVLLLPRPLLLTYTTPP